MIEEIFILTTETCQKHPGQLSTPVSLRFPISTRQNMSEARNSGSPLYCIETSYISGKGGLQKITSLICTKRGGYFCCLIKRKQKCSHISYSWKGRYHTQNTDSKGDTLGFECTCGSYSVAVSQMFSLHISTGVSHLMAF